jgi:hypothetical protein
MFLQPARLCLAVLAASAAWVHAADVTVSNDTVKIVAGDKHIDFIAHGKLMARYECGPEVAKPYFWPLNSPTGEPITRAWPMEPAAPNGSTDHVHQKSAWFCHGDVIPEGIELKAKVKGVTGVDFWSEAKGHGVIACTARGPIAVKDNRAVAQTRNEWRTAEGVKILDEKRDITFLPVGEGYLLVFDIDLDASVCPITFGDTKEGSFGIRINDALREQAGKKAGTGKLTNAEGKTTDRQVWGMKSAWCDYSGPLHDKMVGLTIFDDPANPPPCWHSRGYGLMAANPFGRAHAGFPGVKGQTQVVKLAKGDHLKLRYGIYVHSGDVKEGKVAEEYQKFVKLKVQS